MVLIVSEINIIYLRETEFQNFEVPSLCQVLEQNWNKCYRRPMIDLFENISTTVT